MLYLGTNSDRMNIHVHNLCWRQCYKFSTEVKILVFSLVFLVDIVSQGAKQVTGVCVLSKVLFKAGLCLAVTHHCDSGLCNCSLAEA